VLPDHRFSKPALSTTQPPLRFFKPASANAAAGAIPNRILHIGGTRCKPA